MCSVPLGPDFPLVTAEMTEATLGLISLPMGTAVFQDIWVIVSG